MGKVNALQRTLGFADDAGDAVRALVADESLFAAFRNPEVFQNLPPDLQRKVLANDPSALTDLMSLGRARANVDDIAARATPSVEIPYANEGVGRREAPLDMSGDWTNGTGSAAVGYSGPGMMQFPPPAVVGGERGLTVIDAAPTPGAGRVDRVFDTSPEMSGSTSLAPFGTRGAGVPVGDGRPRGLIVRPTVATPRGMNDASVAAIATGLAGAGLLYGLAKDAPTTSSPAAPRGPAPADPVSILMNMGLSRQRAKMIAAHPEDLSSRERSMIEQLPPNAQNLFLPH